MKKQWKFWLSLSLIPLFGFWIHPTMKTVKSQKTKVEKLENTRNEKIKKLKALEAKKDEIPEQIQTSGVLKKIPISLEQENLIRDMYKIGHLTGYKFNGLSFGKGKNKNIAVPQMTINFSVSGPYGKLKKFLQTIEQNERFLGMENFSISINQKDGIKTASFSVSLYAFAQE